jgi:hypothetical protein
MAVINSAGVSLRFPDVHLAAVQSGVLDAAKSGTFGRLMIADEIEAEIDGDPVDRLWGYVLIGPGIPIVISADRDVDVDAFDAVRIPGA